MFVKGTELGRWFKENKLVLQWKDCRKQYLTEKEKKQGIRDDSLSALDILGYISAPDNAQPNALATTEEQAHFYRSDCGSIRDNGDSARFQPCCAGSKSPDS